MACPTKYQKSSLRAYNSTEQAFTTPGNIKFSNIGYISGASISLKENSDTVYLRTNGLYYITIDVIMSNATAATDTTVQLYVDGDEVHVVCSPCERIYVGGQHRCHQRKIGRHVTEFVTKLKGKEKFVRAEVMDAAGRSAYTNPIWLD